MGRDAASLVVQTSFLGDVILTTPLIAALARRGPVDVVTTVAGAGVLANNPDVRRLIVYDKRGQDQGVVGFMRVRARVRGSEFGGVLRRKQQADTPQDPSKLLPTTAYLAQGSLRSATLAVAAGCRTRIGFNTSAGKWLYTQRVLYRDDWHHARRLLALWDADAAANADDEWVRPRLYPGPQDVAAVDALLAGRHRPVVVLAPGSAWATKRWPYYPDLARLLGEEADVAIVGAADDRPLADEMVTAVGPAHVIDAVGRLSLLGSAELIRRAAVVVTNDSSPQHLASAMGTPTIAIFGPTVPDFGFGPLAPMSRVIGHEGLACRPCDRHGPQRCPLQHWRCMREVWADDVYDAVLDVLLTTTP